MSVHPLYGQLEELEAVCSNIATYDPTPSDDDRTYRQLRDQIEATHGDEWLPSIIKTHRNGRRLRAASQARGGYADRREWIEDSFRDVFQALDIETKRAGHAVVLKTRGAGVTVATAAARNLSSKPSLPTSTLPPSSPPETPPFPAYYHPELRARCQSDYERGDYPTAILKAFRYVEVRVRELAKLASTDIGVGLVSKAMSSKNARIVFSDVEAEQEGYHSTFRGALATLKNPLSHKEVEHLDRGRTLERLAFASMLLKDLDEAKVRIPEPEQM